MKIQYWDESELGDIETVCPDRNIKLGSFSGCTIDGHGIHYPQPLLRKEEELILPTIERFMSLGRGTVYEETMEFEPKQPQIKTTKENNVFYFVYNCANYFHWIYDTLPYLYVYFLQKQKDPSLKLLTSPPEGEKDLYPFVYESLELLGIPKEDLIFLDPHACYKRILIGSSLTHNRLSLDPPHKGLYEVLEQMKGSEGVEEKIYISRRTWTQPHNPNIGTDYTQKRKCANEDEVVDIFKKHGFKEIFCENLTMEEKVGAFRNAKIVAGASGGGMSNVLFCSPDTKVISINSPEFFEVNKRLEHAMTHTKLYHFDETEFVDRQEDVRVDKNSLSIAGGMNSPWKVDLKKLENLVAKVVN
jgi:capsular polysaccharide biosynthesis protein